jgi:putative addiction module killer protein
MAKVIMRHGSTALTLKPPRRLRRPLHDSHSANFSNVKGVGSGVFEYRIDFGPGYRIYFGKDGERLLILLGGGTKGRQQSDISAAVAS